MPPVAAFGQSFVVFVKLACSIVATSSCRSGKGSSAIVDRGLSAAAPDCSSPVRAGRESYP